MDGSIGKESACNTGDPGLIPGLGRSTGEGIGLPTPIVLGFPGSWAGEESTCNAGDAGSIPELDDPWRREQLPTPVFWPTEFHGLVYGVAKNRTRLSIFHFHAWVDARGIRTISGASYQLFCDSETAAIWRKSFKKNILKRDWHQRQNKFSFTIFIPHFLKLTFQSNIMTAKNISEFLEKIIAFIYL